MNNSQEKAIREFVNLSEETKRLIRLANHDLYYGPLAPEDEDEEWPGFSKACEAICDALPGDLWVDENDNVSATEPDYEDEDPYGWVHYDSRAVARVLVGKELAGYV